MPVITITDPADSRIAPYISLTEACLRNRLDPSNALFIAESPKVIKVALDAGYTLRSMLCERRHIDGDAADIISRCDPSTPIYTGDRNLLASITGYTLTRGVLAAMTRPAPQPLSEVVATAHRVAVIDSVTDTTNIGAIFRSAAALGIDAIALTRTSCDPFNRRSVRVSMGSVFLIPWTWVDDPVAELKSAGFTTIAMALRPDALSLDDTDSLARCERLAVIFGTEGDGLSQQVIDAADYTVMIPMAHGVDSLNVAAASAVTFWQLRVADAQRTHASERHTRQQAHPS